MSDELTDREKLQMEIENIHGRSWTDGFVWGIVAALALILAGGLIFMRLHP